MTAEELEIFKLKAQLEALRVLVRGLYTALANNSPSEAQALRGQFAALRLDHSKIVLKGVSPEYSDMLSSEYQSSLEDLLSFIESGIKS